MTLAMGIAVLAAFGMVYAAVLVWVAWANARALRRSGENGVYAHEARGDVRRAITDLMLAFLMFAVFAVPFTDLPPVIRVFVTQSAVVGFVLVFVLGLAMARHHQVTRPRNGPPSGL